VFLAYLPARQTSALVSREVLTGGGDRHALVAAVLASGVGQVSGDLIPGLSAVAAPVLNASGEAAAVMTLIAARHGIAPAAVDRLRLAAAKASARLGFSKHIAHFA
jgi:DNA-binding IclR family transcriptional regulator